MRGPLPFDANIQAAFRALNVGQANEGQQALVLDHILNVLCGLPKPSFQATDRDTAFAEGRKFPAYQIAYMIDPATKPPADMKQRQEAHD